MGNPATVWPCFPGESAASRAETTYLIFNCFSSNRPPTSLLGSISSHPTPQYFPTSNWDQHRICLSWCMPLFLEDPKPWVKVALDLNVYLWRSGHTLLNPPEEEIRVYLLRASQPRSENILSDPFSLQTIETIATKRWSSLSPPWLLEPATAPCENEDLPFILSPPHSLMAWPDFFHLPPWVSFSQG